MNSKKELGRKVQQLEKINNVHLDKITALKLLLSEARQERNYYRRRVKELSASRSSWKTKHKSKQLEIRNLQSKLSRRDHLPRYRYSVGMMSLCIFLRIVGGCSYRGIVRILGVLRFCLMLNFRELPCANSIQNWVSKVGLYQLNQATNSLPTKEVSFIIDESIRLGQEKQLLILSVPWHKARQAALSFEDVEVLHIEGAKSWTGEKIAQVIDRLVQRHDLVLKNILSDEDGKLKKAARLSQVAHLPEISHAIATCLKNSFGKLPEYKAFTTLLASYQSKGVNQELSYLCPPKQRAKARFMNQQGIIKWSTKMLQRWDQLRAQHKTFFAQLPQHQPLIDQLALALDTAKTISLSFKTTGLSAKSLKEAKQEIQTYEKQPLMQPQFLQNLKDYLAQYQHIIDLIGKQVIHASSEIIESFFGKYKEKAHNHPLTGLTRLNLEIPLYTLKNRELLQIIPIALKHVSMTQIHTWIELNATDSQLAKRTKFFKNNTKNTLN